MKKIAVLLSIVLLLCSTPVLPANAADSKMEQSVRILFIGNSYTYYNDFCDIFQNLCQSAGKLVYVRQAVQGRHSLLQASRTSDPLGRYIRQLLTTQKWDYVVLQERHNFPVLKPARTKAGVKALEPYIKAAGAKMILYQNWAPAKGHKEYRKFSNRVSGRADYQLKINRLFSEIASETGAKVAPVGTAFFQCQGTFSKIRLIRRDHSHPTWAGSYLAACVMYATLFETSPEGISYRGNLTATKAAKLKKMAALATAS